MGITERSPSPFSKRQNSIGGENKGIVGCMSHAPTTHDDDHPSSPHTSCRPPLLRPSHSTHLVHSLARLSSSRRLSVTCSGSDLGQLYLSSPEQDAVDFLNSNTRPRSFKRNRADSSKTWSDSWGNLSVETSSTAESDVGDAPQSWMDAVDLYGKRKSFSCRRNSYVKFLDVGVVDEEEISLLIEETRDEAELDQNKSIWISPSMVVPFLMLLDLTLGISLSLYDSNLLRNVPGFHFPLCYAWIQKFTNALASLVLICLSRRWERRERERLRQQKPQFASGTEEQIFTEMPSIQVFRQNAIPLTAIAIVQTISAACANCSLQILPLPLFKVVLMCGPIFVAFLTSAIEGNVYSRGRIMALGLIGAGALRAVYAEAEGADNPRGVMEGSAYALAASALSGMGLVISGVLMHRDPVEEETYAAWKEDELSPLSLLFYLSCEQVALLSFYLCPWETLWSENNFQPASDGSSEFLEFVIYSRQHPHKATLYLMIGSTISFCLAILTFTLVTRTSPVAASLLGNVRSIATVAISSVVSGGIGNRGTHTSVFETSALGYVLTLAGGLMYALSPATTTTNNS